jgi:hypothetical protein
MTNCVLKNLGFAGGMSIITSHVTIPVASTINGLVDLRYL